MKKESKVTSNSVSFRKFSFEKLEVWQLSVDLSKEIYKITSSFPDEEKYGMTSQLRRAAISISNNLAEGSGRATAKDQASFTNIAYASLMEVLNMLILSVELGFIQPATLNELRPQIEKLSNKLDGFYKAQRRRSKGNPRSI